MNDPNLHWQTLTRLGAVFRRHFLGTYSRWDICGAARRQKPGEELKHVVIPLAGDGAFDNGVWQRAAELAALQTLRPWPHPRGNILWVEPDATLIAAELGGSRHEICLATAENWGARIAQHTGPEGYWQMLLWRLREAGTLDLRNGMVCAIDRINPAVRGETMIPCGEERKFFRLARTAWKSPRGRFERPGADATNDWTRGMLPEWVPPGLAVYADPSRSPQLFDGSKPVPRRYAGKDGLPWIHA